MFFFCIMLINVAHMGSGAVMQPSWLRGTVVERRSLAGELSLSYVRPVADG